MTATVYEKARAALAWLPEDVLPLALDLLLGLEDPENVAMLRRELENRSQPNPVE